MKTALDDEKLDRIYKKLANIEKRLEVLELDRNDMWTDIQTLFHQKWLK